jgi:hypothetical protein
MIGWCLQSCKFVLIIGMSVPHSLDLDILIIEL